MSIKLNHTVVLARDNAEGARFLADILGLEAGPPLGPFVPVVLSNDVMLDFYTVPGHTERLAHYAFLMSEAEFDLCLSRLRRAEVIYYSGPRLDRAGEINHQDGGRGLYFLDPTGNTMEIITRPYGDAPPYRERWGASSPGDESSHPAHPDDLDVA